MFGRIARFAYDRRSHTPVSGLPFRSCRRKTPPDISSGARSVTPADCIEHPQAYNPHNHRSHGGSVQRGLSAANAAAARFSVCAAADKRYSFIRLNEGLGFVFSSTVYVRVNKNQFRVRNIESSAEATVMATVPFTTHRLLIGQFGAAEETLKKALTQVAKGGFLAPSPQVVIHPLELVDGGLSEIEDRALREVAIAAGASKVVVWLGRELNDAEVKEKLLGK